MLRTNIRLLNSIEQLYAAQPRKEDIILRTFSAGERLLEQDCKAEKVFIIQEGLVKCYLTEKNDKRYLFEFLGKGEIVGEIEAIKKQNCLCTIEAISPVTAYSISIPFFLSLIDRDPEIPKLLLFELTDRISNTSSRASFQQLYTVEYGLSKLLQLQEVEKIRLSKEDMAAYLGISVRSLNRTLKQLES
ncbi:Crp/Fnr family transcriptional regulator [Pedobacter sp. HMWF019]|uniref:Crp/Fnr family transcriptional regulator n=1 Tax=Pedobacter sp. HMWF019 TaxID=2056856 RepID=UPI000D3385F8|nr:Crp/Fnr family transcriptional regulator [Pedobacter sp. HMWF019]PTT01526.1 Crp/Fnr family transcriptional regulator [Pedobacter sp. HMWF019]